jgi:hypothetical protein
MSSIAYNRSENFNLSELEREKVIVNESNVQHIKNKQYFNNSEQDISNDVSTASYVRGYN